ncbi:MAG TPA: M64 family metallopeptidase [Planctomycetota bacterium]|jgi:hypothetical protein|nr:FHA domain-containing protein [Planctomycetota bacterium]OQC21869.1 MAG: Glycogen accumulation regulator GarA [Planctomycetes bacterium ADurb.Bin069]HNR98180.1 M64 family metallopeptidase [Planctomycetota bacterium]HNU24951.1 M64 family metallopeptidase [Planctomycetota bacterium]HOE29553.1 M64 family metallopeptidase [Planctomycetota bacterium]
MDTKHAPRASVPLLLRITEEGVERLAAYTGREPFWIGRADDCRVVLRDVRASRRHAQIIHDVQGVSVVDAGSLNGTRLNGARIERAILAFGDVIEIGDARIAVSLPAEASAPPPARPATAAAPAPPVRRLASKERHGKSRLRSALTAAACGALLVGAAWLAWTSAPALRAKLAATARPEPPPPPPPTAAPVAEPPTPPAASEAMPRPPEDQAPASAPASADQAEALRAARSEGGREALHAFRELAESQLAALRNEQRFGEAAAIARFLARATPDTAAAQAWETLAAALEKDADLALDALRASLSDLTAAGKRGEALAVLLATRARYGGLAAFEELLPAYLEAALAPPPPPAEGGPAAEGAVIALEDRAAAALEACAFRELVNTRYLLLAQDTGPARRQDRLAGVVRALYMEQMYDQWRTALAKEPIEISLSEIYPGRISAVEGDRVSYELDIESRKAAVRDAKPWRAIPPPKKFEIFKAAQLAHGGMAGLVFFGLETGNEEAAVEVLANLHRWEKSRELADAIFALHTGQPVPDGGFVVFEGRLVTPDRKAEVLAERARREAEAAALAEELRAAGKAAVLGTAVETALRLRRQGAFVNAHTILAAVAGRFPRTAEGARARELIDDPLLAVRPLGGAGDGRNRLALYFLAEGYPLKDDAQEAFLALARGMYALLITNEPFREYQSYLTADAIQLASKDQGVDRMPGDIVRDTVLGGRIQWDVFTADAAKARAICARAGGAAAGSLAIVIGNDCAGVATGGGGMAAIPKTFTSALAHELGHALGGLRDEYDTIPGTNPRRGEPAKREKNMPVRPLPPNLMAGSDRDEVLARASWRAWIDAGKSRWWNGAGVGAFEGGDHTPFNVWRPQAQCMMRTSGAHFCVVCMEVMVKSIYRFVRPIDAAEPEAGEVALRGDETLLFKVYPMKPRSRFLDTTWSLARLPASGAGGPTAVRQEPTAVPLPRHGRRFEPDGRVSEVLRFGAADLEPGRYRLAVKVRDSTPWVLTDEENLLSQTREWTITVAERSRELPVK